MPLRRPLSTSVADEQLKDKLMKILNLFQSEDEEADQYWYLLGVELRRLNPDKYDYPIKVLVRFGQAEEGAPEELLKDLLEKGAYLEDVVTCLEKISCKKAVDLLYDSPRVVRPVEEQGGRADYHNSSHDNPDSSVENQLNNIAHPVNSTDPEIEEPTSTSNLIGQEMFTVREKPVIETHPVPAKAKRGHTVEFHCLSRTPGVAYAWFKNGITMKGKVNRKLELVSVGPDDEAVYYCTVSNALGQVYSDEARLTLTSNIVVTQQPKAKQVLQIYNGKQMVKLNCQARSTTNSTLEYQWQKICDREKVEETYPPSDTAERDIPVVFNKLQKRYRLIFRCKITDKQEPSNFTYSDKAIVKVEIVWITRELMDVNAKLQTPASLRCDGKGYKECNWLRSNTDDGRAKFYKQTKVPVLYFPHLSQEDEGYYMCNLSNGGVHVTTRRAHLRPYMNEETKRVPMLKVLSEPNSRVVQSGTPLRLEFQVSCSTDDPVVYQWYFNGVKIAGECVDNLVREGVTEEHCGRYHCEAMVGGAKVTSRKVTVRRFYEEDQSDEASPSLPSEVNRTYRYDSAGYRFAHDKVALLIGNRSYVNLKKLDSPENDIQQLSKVLQDLDFKVFALVDLTYSEMQCALNMFYKSLVKHTYALFYFSGHGFNDTYQNSYIAPVDCPSNPSLDKCFHLSNIIIRMQAQKCRPLCVIDACRLVDFSVSTRHVSGIQNTSNYMLIYSTGDNSAAKDTGIVNGEPTATSPFNQKFIRAIESECPISDLANKILAYSDDRNQSIDPRGQFRDSKISLHDEIFVSEESIVKDLKRIESDYGRCIEFPEPCWLSEGDMKELSAYAKLLLEFSLLLTNVWQLKVSCYLVSGEANSAHIDFDIPFLEGQGVEVAQLVRSDSPQDKFYSVCSQLRGLQKLKSSLKILMKVTVHVGGEPKTVTLSYQTEDIPCIASHFKSN